MIERFIFWIKTRVKCRAWECSKTCLFCPFFKECQEEYEYIYGRKGK